MSLDICCIILLLIHSVLQLLIDCTGVVKLGIFMTSMGISGLMSIFSGSFDRGIFTALGGSQ